MQADAQAKYLGDALADLVTGAIHQAAEQVPDLGEKAHLAMVAAARALGAATGFYHAKVGEMGQGDATPQAIADSLIDDQLRPMVVAALEKVKAQRGQWPC